MTDTPYEVLFKGKRKDNGLWVFGSLRLDHDLETAYISGYTYYSSAEGLQREPFEHEVIPKTVCQYVGLNDKNKRRIFNQDKVKLPSFEPSIMYIGFIEGAFCLTNESGEYVADIHYIHHAGKNEVEVLGNIHDM